MRNRLADQIAELVTVPDVLQKYGYSLGRRRRIPCPLHDGKDANFAYTDEVYHCWTCGAKGNVIRLVMDLFDLNFGQALVKINNDFTLGLSDERPTYRQRLAEQKRQEELRKLRKEKETVRRRYLQACRLHAVLYSQLLQEPEIEGLSEYVDQLEWWLDEHVKEVVI